MHNGNITIKHGHRHVLVIKVEGKKQVESSSLS